MRLGETTKMQAAINVTPLVDVVLVLLIIFMVIAPQMRKGPEVNMPKTAKPTDQGDERGRILVPINDAGQQWINNQQVSGEHFGEALRVAAGPETARTSVQAGPAQSAELRLILTIAPATCRILEPPAGEGLPADCQVILANQKIPAAELPARVAEILGNQPAEKRVLFLDADDRLNYEGVLRILDLAKSNVEDLKIEFLTNH